jgi:hypothetical protein
MNVFVHIIRSSSGQGLDVGILSSIINSLNSNFQNSEIQFVLLDHEFIDNDYYYTNLTGKESQLFSVNFRCNAMNIYVLGTSTTWTNNGFSVAGMAESIPATALNNTWKLLQYNEFTS